MRFRSALLAVVVAGCLVLGGIASTASAAPRAPTAVTVPISTTQSGGVLSGVLTITNFAVNSAGQLVANGVFTGTATVNGVTQTITSIVSVVVGSATGSCTILDLTLGPLHLDLLGLVVDLNQVHLTITAQSGPGNLLGNLLCAVAHLLDSSAAPIAFSNMLNHLLRA